MSFDGPAADDVYDITRYVQPVTVHSALVGEPLVGFTNGKSVFLTEDQVITIARSAPAGTLVEIAPQQWEELVPGKGRRILAQRHIDEVTYYRFKGHWDFVPGPAS